MQNDKIRICGTCAKPFERRQKFRKFCSVECKRNKPGQLSKKQAISRWRLKKRSERTGIDYVQRRESILSADAFYASQQWQRLRFEAFLKYGRQCLCCGAMPPTVVLHVDHVKSRVQYPDLALDINNLQILCEACNMGKGGRHETDFRKR